MFSILTNLTKAAVSVAVAPVAVAVDVVKLPVTADSLENPFKHTEKVLNNAGECVNEAIKPEK